MAVIMYVQMGENYATEKYILIVNVFPYLK